MHNRIIKESIGSCNMVQAGLYFPRTFLREITYSYFCMRDDLSDQEELVLSNKSGDSFWAKNKKVLLGMLLLVLSGGGYMSYLWGFKQVDPENFDVKVDLFFDVGEIITNISGINGDHYIKIVPIIYVYTHDDLRALESRASIIRDSFIIFLRELRVSDLNGTGGSIKIREELTKRAAAIMRPNNIRAVLIKEVIVN